MRDSLDSQPMEELAAQPASGAGSPQHSPYVLVVDDEEVVRDFLSRCLERGGYAVKQASSAAEALETMVAQPAEAVLCDIRMPGQDGLWLAARLRAHWPKTPVVMASAIDDLQTVHQTRDLGVVDYITKPIKPDQLLEVVRRATVANHDASKDANKETLPVPVEHAAPSPEHPPAQDRIEAEYTLESPVRCPACGERIATLKAVRLVRAQVNFTSTLPRRGRVIACPHCLAIVPAELTNF